MAIKKLMLSLVAACVAGGFVHTVSADPVGSLNAEGEGLTFKEQGAFEIYQWEGADSTGTFTVPEGGATVDLLLVGGGGAGGFCRGGGGGGGGVIYKQSYALDAGSYTVTVGAGGVPDAWTPTSSDDPYKNSGSSTEGTDGKSSVLSKATETVFEAFGGGGGGTFISGQNSAFSQYGSSSAGRTGASAGGSANRQGSVAADGFGQGNAGGAAWSGGDASSGGGGGASAAGGSASAKELAGDGGAGYECPITGTLIAYGGGGAGLYSGTAGAGGAGGGGHGGNQGSGGQNAGMTAGVDGLGGGGGGASGAGNKWVACGGGKGGSGVVVVRYQKAGAMALNVQVDAGNARELDVTASVTASDGAETDTFDIYLACSDSDENFDYAKVGEDVALNAEVSKAFVGLDSDSLYYVAAKAYNRTTGKWSDPLVSQWRTSAAESPVQIMGPGITKTETGYEVFVRIDHFQGNVSDCTLTYKGEAKAVTGVGTYVWQVKSAESDFSATVDLAYQAGGISYGKAITQKTSGGASVHIADFATLDECFFFEGDRILLPEGSYSVLGDAIATVSGNVVYCKKSGFTLLHDGVSDYRVCVVPHPPAGGDVFYYFSNNGNGDPWTSATWTKVTQNTERTYPDDENDVAVIEGGCTWAKMLINDDISLHGYVVGVARTITSGDGWVQLETANGKALTFCGSEVAPAIFNLSSMSRQTCRIRLGKQDGTGDAVLNVSVSGRLNFDWCGDSASAVQPRRGEGQIQWCSAIVTVPEGSTLAFVNDSKVVTDSIVKGGTSVGHIAGAGTVIFGQRGGIPLSLLTFAGDEFAGDVAVRAGEWKGMVEFPDSDLTVFDAPNAGRKTIGIGYDLCTSNPGRSQIDAKSVTLDGGCMKIYRNYAENSNLTPWTEGATTEEEKAARLTVTNEIKKLVVKGDSAFYCDCSYGTTRVRQHLILDEIEHDKTGTLCLYDFNFRDKGQRLDPLHYDRVKGRGLAAHAVGRDPQEGDPQTVYKIIPWMACTVNDNGFGIYDSWGSQMNFPALVNGELKDVYGRTSSDLSKVGEWDNVFFTQKGISALGGKTIHSFAYDTGETAPYPGNLVLGAGKTLTIKSGGLIMARTGRWLGCTQTAKFAENGSVAFGGERAYVICDFGKPEGSGGSREYDVIWTSMVAPNGLTKGGCGELVFATDQRGIDGDIVIGGGTLWLGHPANYRKDGWLYENQSDTIPVRGCVTDVEEFTLRPGAVLAIPSKGYDVDGSGTIDEGETAISKNAVITLIDNAAGSSKVEIAAGADQTCKKLYISGRNKGKALKRGTYGATGSGAANIDDDHFVGSGVLTVRKDDVSGSKIILR